MVEAIRVKIRLEQEAQRCERLGMAVYDRALSEQLLCLARDYRGEAARLSARGQVAR